MAKVAKKHAANQDTEIKTFQKYDKLGRQVFATRLTNVISKFFPFADGAYVLSLNASFGSGKSTFLEMWKAQLEDQGYSVIHLNAWESDFDDEPIVPIATGLLENIGSSGAGKKAKAALLGVVGVAALVGNTVVDHVTGLNVKEIMTDVEKSLSEDEVQKLGEEVSSAFTKKKKIYRQLRDSLTEYVHELQPKPLIVLVDELDRVRPDYSVKFLEAIKHIFSVKGVCFVLAIDRKQLEASVKQLYGEIDFDNYYRRFVSREAELGDPSSVNWDGFIDLMGQEYFDEKTLGGVSFAFHEDQKKDILKHAVRLCLAFQMTPRQTQLLFRIFSQFMAVSDNSATYLTSWFRAAMFLIVLFIKNKEAYDKIGHGRMSVQEMAELIRVKDFSWDKSGKMRLYMTMEAISFCLTQEDQAGQKQAVAIARTMGAKGEEIDMRHQLAKTVSVDGEFPNDRTEFQILYARLEDWRSFIDQ